MFEGITDDDLAVLGAQMEERHVDPGEHLARQGASGCFFGEAAILESTRRTATVTATSPMTGAAMFGADFAKCQADHPEMHTRILQALAERRTVET